MTDSMHIKANANKHRFETKVVKERTKDCIAELNQAIARDRAAHQKKPLRVRKEVTEEREVKASLANPKRGYMYWEGKPEGFYYLDHRTVDAKYNFITDVHIAAGNVHDTGPYMGRLERQIERFGFQVEAVALDSGYLSTPICNALQNKRIFAVIGHRRFHSTQGLFPKWRFHFDAESDVYTCPAKHQEAVTEHLA